MEYIQYNIAKTTKASYSKQWQKNWKLVVKTHNILATTRRLECFEKPLKNYKKMKKSEKNEKKWEKMRNLTMNAKRITKFR